MTPDTSLSGPHARVPDAEPGLPAAARDSAARLNLVAVDTPKVSTSAEALRSRPRVPRAFQMLAIAASALLLAAAIFVMLDRRQEAHWAAHRAAASELQMLSQRIAAYAQRAAARDAQAFEILQTSGERFTAALGTLTAGVAAADSRTMTPAAGAALASLQQRWKGVQDNVQQVLTQPVAEAHRAALEIAAETDPLLDDALHLAAAFPRVQHSASRYIWAALVAAALALACLLWIGKIMLDDAERRAAENLRNAVRNRQANERTQEAILRLLNEMGNLAQGDLTVRASVTDEVTGAIADAVNYAVGELRRLVLGINDAASRLADACGQAQTISGELLNASQRQAQEIVASTTAVAAVRASVTRVSERAAQSANVADASLEAAAQGSDSVRRSVAGIEAIRQQMQDTAKRIKRLGESSQEIGEIVDLISDITGRTNVLALNAAIQANAAGGSGRGFGLVAEEVQRLAERSAQAAQQINAIVKTIQADTQDATSAMERSTEHVVEQTGLAYAAGDALGRIDQVSRQLAGLIGAISAATRDQSDSAERIRAAMVDILRITQLTTDGTRKTADRAAQLAGLARELKQSVAGFKLS